MDHLIVFTIVGLALAYIGRLYFKKFMNSDKSPHACGCASCSCSNTCKSFNRHSEPSEKNET